MAEPPFRADHVGSLLRPPELLRAREQHRAGRLSAAELRRVEDAAIRDAARFQAEIGLQGVTDGEYRRGSWHMDFLYRIGGVEKTDRVLHIQFKNDAGTLDFTPAAHRVAGKLTLNDPPAGILPPGSGPRHIAFSRDGRLLYVLSELKDTVTTFRWDATKGALESTDSLSALPAGYTGPKSGAEIAVHPTGKFLYTSNRGHDTIAMFAIAADGKLAISGHQPTRGKTPRNFAIDPSGKFLLAANQDSSTIAVFRVDGKTGGLTPVGDPVAVPTPVSILFAARQ